MRKMTSQKYNGEQANVQLLPLSDNMLVSCGMRRLGSGLPTSWRLTVACGSLLAFLVFLLNTITTLFIYLRPKSVTVSRNTIFDGNCNKAKQLNVVIHLLINILSTALLSTSNYAMQCLSAPTRQEVDAAHALGYWLDIGVLSPRNFTNIKLKKAVLWVILGLSSLPLHLL